MKKSKTKNLLKIITNPSYRFESFGTRGFYNHLSDEEYIRRMFEAKLGYSLDLDNPRTFNEKLQWLKLYDRKQIYTAMVDKYAAKEYVASILGEKYIIPTLGVWERFEDIDFDSLPNQFVLKCTHDSGGLVVVKNKDTFDYNAAKKKISASIKRNYYFYGREWPYKDIKPHIIAEKYMEDTETAELRDYKFFCFGGTVDCVMVCTERQSGEAKFYFFDKDWKLRRWNIRGKNAPANFTLSKPSNMDEMFEVAEKLSGGLPFVRVDLYSVNGSIYFGELTLYPQSGFDANLLSEADLAWGNMIDLTKVNENGGT